MRAGVIALVTFWCAVAHAEPSSNYAIVVGSNAGGPGQGTLRYAEDDARRMAAVLTELGGYTVDHVDVVAHPSPDQLRDRLAQLAERVQRDTASGRQVRVFFYYSGHARAQAIDLGSAELPLDELRERLFKIGASLTVVVLDACQSGAFSRIKGAAPAADFSYSSRQRLDATGVAVMASSSGSELSQESEQLQSSYFTHHLLVGMRGAGDANNDGEVSIDEAYRYAYHQTLLATAETAVGGQHVTFEAELKGHGEVPLSFPRAATARITLPPQLEGKTLVEDRRSHTVVAETYKAKGAAVRIAVAPGDYDVLVRHGDQLSRCTMTAPGEVDLARCRTEGLVTTTPKGGVTDDDGVDAHRYIFALEVLAGGENHDGYTRNLQAFGYTEDARPSEGIRIAFLTKLQSLRRVWIGASAAREWLPSWTHAVVGHDLMQKLDWGAGSVMATIHGEESWPASWLSEYASVSAGLGVGGTDLTGADGKAYHSNDAGFAWALGARLRAHVASIGIELGLEYSANYAIHDLIENTHTTGGYRAVLGITKGY
ncbi:hypothetical protein BH11MYX1_BH11MYX1_40200 [soil metagenome]